MTHRFNRHTDRKRRLRATHRVVELGGRLTAGRNIQIGLNKETAEKQDAQDNNDGDYDDLNQAHSKLLDWLRAGENNQPMKAKEF